MCSLLLFGAIMCFFCGFVHVYVLRCFIFRNFGVQKLRQLREPLDNGVLHFGVQSSANSENPLPPRRCSFLGLIRFVFLFLPYCFCKYSISGDMEFLGKRSIWMVFGHDRLYFSMLWGLIIYCPSIHNTNAIF